MDGYEQMVEDEVDTAVDHVETYLDEGRPYEVAIHDAMYDVETELSARWGANLLAAVTHYYRGDDPDGENFPHPDGDDVKNRVAEAMEYAPNTAYGALCAACDSIVLADIEAEVRKRVDRPDETTRVRRLHDFAEWMADADFVTGRGGGLIAAAQLPDDSTPPEHYQISARVYRYEDGEWRNVRGTQLDSGPPNDIYVRLNDLINEVLDSTNSRP